MSKRVSTASRVVSAVVVVFLLAGPLSPRAFADHTVTATKTITWRLDGKPADTVKGSYVAPLAAFATDNHIGDIRSGAFAGEWLLNQGLPSTPRTTGLAGGGGHPDAEAIATFQFDAPRKEGSRWLVTGQLKVEAKADTVPWKPGDHKDQHAFAVAAGTLQIKGARVTGVTVKEPGKELQIVPNAKFKEGLVNLGAEAVKGRWTDPVSIELTEFESGKTHLEEILSTEVRSANAGQWSWDPTDGIVLDVPVDGRSSAEIDLRFLSSWITSPGISPGTSSVSLADGVFATTGLFDGLPWDLTFQGSDVVAARLGPGFFGSIDLEYRIPESLIVDTNTYQQTLLVDSFVRVTAVPAPGAFLLGIIGLGMVVLIKHGSSKAKSG